MAGPSQIETRPANALEVGGRPVGGFQDRLVVLEDLDARPEGYEIQPRRALIALRQVQGQQAAFFLQAAGQLRRRQRGQQADHANRNVGGLDAVDHRFGHT